jgi:hypothetical protein
MVMDMGDGQSKRALQPALHRPAFLRGGVQLSEMYYYFALHCTAPRRETRYNVSLRKRKMCTNGWPGKDRTEILVLKAKVVRTSYSTALGVYELLRTSSSRPILPGLVIFRPRSSTEVRERNLEGI